MPVSSIPTSRDSEMESISSEAVFPLSLSFLLILLLLKLLLPQTCGSETPKALFGFAAKRTAREDDSSNLHRFLRCHLPPRHATSPTS